MTSGPGAGMWRTGFDSISRTGVGCCILMGPVLKQALHADMMVGLVRDARADLYNRQADRGLRASE